MRTGLVLEGGAMRGLFSAGVIDVMMEHGMLFDGMVGVSAGAAFGCNYKSGQVGRVIRYNKLLAKDWRHCSWRSWLFTGDLVGAEFAYHHVPVYIDRFDKEAFEANPMEFIAVCTDVETGKPIYKELNRGGVEMLEWLRASASMPVCSRFVELDGRKLLDGGVTDSIPLEFMEKRGYKRNVVVLTQPLGYEKRINKLMPLMRVWYYKYPAFVRAMAERHVMYNQQLQYVAEAEREGRAIVVRPPYALPIGHVCHDPKQMQQVYEIGRATAEALSLRF